MESSCVLCFACHLFLVLVLFPSSGVANHKELSLALPSSGGPDTMQCRFLVLHVCVCVCVFWEGRIIAIIRPLSAENMQLVYGTLPSKVHALGLRPWPL